MFENGNIRFKGVGSLALMGLLTAGFGNAFAAPTVPATLPSAGAAAHLEEMQRQIDLLGQEVQKLKTGSAASEPIADQMSFGFGPGASKVYRAQSGFTLGGYGEVLYEHFSGKAFNPDGSVVPGKRIAPGEDYDPSNGQSRFDISRAVLYTGYKFNDHLVLNSELEWEHGGDEIEVEFLYIDTFFRKELNFRFGNLLIPVGPTNETHEPTTYLGTHRSTVETLIIPTTWHEYGLGVFGDIGSLSYRAYLVGGMNASGFTPDVGVREGRHERGFANANHMAGVARADYAFTPTFTTGGAFYIGSASTEPTPGFNLVSVPMKMVEAHAQYLWHALDIRAMGAYSWLSNIDELNAEKAAGPGDSVGSRQGGFNAQIGYDLINNGMQSLIPFVRWEVVNTQVAVPSGYVKNPNNLVREYIFGVDYKPVPQLVFKGDYQVFSLGDHQGVNQVDASIGYVF